MPPSATSDRTPPVLSASLREDLLTGAPHADERYPGQALRAARLAWTPAPATAVRVFPEANANAWSSPVRCRVAPGYCCWTRPPHNRTKADEAALRDAVVEEARATTVLVVAHRLSTVTMADRIVVMDAGQVRAVGTHAEVVEADPLYGEPAATRFLAAG
ncbi:hypothetical protein GCM10027091_37820 [Streptomyces daliensis]